MELDALIRALAPGDVIGRRAVEISDLAHDTRRVGDGTLFFCVRGARADGHDLAAEAVTAGAGALVVEHPVDVAVPQLVVESSRAAMAVARGVHAAVEETAVAGAAVGVRAFDASATAARIMAEAESALLRARHSGGLARAGEP